MAAPVSFGSGIQALADESAGGTAGLYARRVAFDMGISTSFATDSNGADIGVTVHNEASTYEIQGFYTVLDDLGQSLGAAMTTASANLDMLKNESTDATPEVLVTGLSGEKLAGDYMQGTVRGIHRPAIALS